MKVLEKERAFFLVSLFSSPLPGSAIGFARRLFATLEVVCITSASFTPNFRSFQTGEPGFGEAAHASTLERRQTAPGLLAQCPQQAGYLNDQDHAFHAVAHLRRTHQ